MNIQKFREVIKQRIYAEEISSGEWDEEFERCRKELVEILTEDMPSSIDFIKNECTADEYTWISEILEEIVEKVNFTYGYEFLNCYKSLKEKFSEEYKKYNIDCMIRIAEDVLAWEKEHGEKK